VLPAAVWSDPAVLRLCAEHDAAGLFRLAKRYGVSNERLAYWVGVDAAEVSRRLHDKAGPVTALHRWQAIAEGLNMPDGARVAVGLAPVRWRPVLGQDDYVRRRTVLQAAALGLGAGVAGAGPRPPARASGADTAMPGGDGGGQGTEVMEQGCGEWLAWQLWQRSEDSMPAAELPAPIARYLDLADARGGVTAAGRRLSPGGSIVCDRGQVAFTDPGHADARPPAAPASPGQAHSTSTAPSRPGRSAIWF